MSRNGSGVYSKPAGTTFTPNTVIESAKVNEVIDDIAADLNVARPIVAGGTGATSAASARTNLAVPGTATVNTFTATQKWAKGADVASASTLTLGDDGNYFDITGTTTITAIATKGVGTRVLLQFDAALTLTHHATDLILPGGLNITTAAGDHAEFAEYATGDWRCVNYVRAADTTLDVASATTTDIGAGGRFNIRITGTTTITGLGTAPEGTLRFVRMAAALTLTHNGTSLILPGSANITTAANDCFLARSLGSGNWLVMFYQKASPTNVTVTAAVATTSGTTIELNTAIPAGVACIKVNLREVSLSGTSQILVQMGTASSYETTGYSSGCANASSGAATTGFSSTAGFIIGAGASASNAINGTLTINRFDGNEWVAELSGTPTSVGSPVTQGLTGGGAKTLSGEVTRIRITTANGSDTFDNGKAGVSYQ